MNNQRFLWNTRGKALDENMIRAGLCRFTVLTPSLLRLEYDPEGRFEDRASQFAFYRDFPQTAYRSSLNGDVLTLETENLKLSCDCSAGFGRDSLRIALKVVPCSVWVPGEEADQLKGTCRTLDGANGPVPLDDGVISRSGYTLVDDSNSVMLTEDGWFALRAGSRTDLYFFGYGHDYRGCIRDFYRLTGVPPLLPDYALGNWWSRYHKYTQEEYTGLMLRFEREQIPFSVGVVDMDWHITRNIPEESRIPNERRDQPGWTGWTWEQELFPDYRGFLKFLHEHNLKTTLNLHPAQGVGCHEVQYPEMAKACGIDPATRQLVRLDILSPDFMANYFDILIHPYEDEGVDFWWMDWQQGVDYWWAHDASRQKDPLEVIDPLWLLNHLHILDLARNGKRPMFFSRYAGLGSHRYPVGFSGDAAMTWEMLNFQPYFTANSSNAGYSLWSHDIGGHHHGYKDDELMVRWMQYGIFSPVNRLHSTDNVFSSKEPWNLQPHLAAAAVDILRLRHRLFPYLYTMNHRCHKELCAMVEPMYYAYPEKDAAYRCANEYLFGTELMCAPITEKNDPVSLRGRTSVWFPGGIWTDFFTGTVYEGERETEVYRPITQMPVFARAGAIVPLQDFDGSNRLGNSSSMTVLVFPGADNRFELFEDEGDGDGWQKGICAKTAMELHYGSTSRFTISAPTGDCSFLPAKRSWTIVLRGFQKEAAVSCSVPAGISYEEETHSFVIRVEELPLRSSVTVELAGDGLPAFDNSDAKQRLYDLLLHAQMPSDLKQSLWYKLMEKPDSDPSIYLQEPCYFGLAGAVRELLHFLDHTKKEFGLWME